MNLASSQILVPHIDLQGIRFSPQGQSFSQDGRDLLKTWPNPTNLRDLRTLATFLHYYRKFIQDYARIAGPLRKAVGKAAPGITFHMLPEVQDALQQLTTALIRSPLLAHPQWDLPFLVDTDWSGDPGAVGGVLSQVHNGQERVIAFGSRPLRGAETRYSANKGETLAILHFLDKWRPYLTGQTFTVRTDHRALQWIKTMEPPQRMVRRWLQILADFRFKTLFRAGQQHGNADGLSRRPPPLIESLPECPPTGPQRSVPLGPKPLIAALLQRVRPLPCIEWRKLQEEDPTISRVLHWVQKGIRGPPPGKDDPRDLLAYWRIFSNLYIGTDTILRKRSPNSTRDRICVPPPLQSILLGMTHDVGGHLGVNQITRQLRERYFIPHLNAVVQNYIQGCTACHGKRNPSRPQRHTLIAPQEGAPFQRWAVDFVGPIPASRAGNTYLLTIKDCFTRWLEALPTSSTTSSEVCRLLETHVFNRYGFPRTLHTDQGTPFASKEFRTRCRQLGISPTLTPSYNPKSNPVERSHRDLNAMIRALARGGKEDWEELLPTMLMAMRMSRHSRTGRTPFQGLYGVPPVLPVDWLHSDTRPHSQPPAQQERIAREREVQIHLRGAMAKAKKRYTQLPPTRPIQVLDRVWLYTPANKKHAGKKLTIHWTGPWLVLRQVNELLYELESGAWNRHPISPVVSVDRLCYYQSNRAPLDLDLTLEDIGALPTPQNPERVPLAPEEEDLEEEERDPAPSPPSSSPTPPTPEPFPYLSFPTPEEEEEDDRGRLPVEVTPPGQPLEPPTAGPPLRRSTRIPQPRRLYSGELPPLKPRPSLYQGEKRPVGRPRKNPLTPPESKHRRAIGPPETRTERQATLETYAQKIARELHQENPLNPALTGGWGHLSQQAEGKS